MQWFCVKLLKLLVSKLLIDFHEAVFFLAFFPYFFCSSAAPVAQTKIVHYIMHVAVKVTAEV